MGYFKTEESKELHRLANIKKNNKRRFDNIEVYNKNPSFCDECGVLLDYDSRNNKFCNKSCSAIYTNRQRSVTKFCIFCNKELINRQTLYCSNDCQSNHQYKVYIKLWKVGLTDGMKGKSGICRYIRIYLFEKYNNSCCECGWNKINRHTGNIPLQIHHIDGIYTNNEEDNLLLLCPSCHSLTDTYGSKNTGNGRKDRYKKQV